MNSNKPSVLVFDVNETLLDITTLEPLFERVFGEAQTLRKWFAELIVYSQTCTLSGIYMPFGDLAVGALRMVADIQGVRVSEADVQELKARLGTMPAHPDVVPALDHLRTSGFRLVTLTNSAPAASPTPMERAGIANYFEAHFSVESVQKFKPHPETYRHVEEQLGMKGTELCLVACHLWDTIGAQSAGWRGALVTRPGNAPLLASHVVQPDIVVPDLGELAARLQ